MPSHRDGEGQTCFFFLYYISIEDRIKIYILVRCTHMSVKQLSYSSVTLNKQTKIDYSLKISVFLLKLNFVLNCYLIFITIAFLRIDSKLNKFIYSNYLR